MSAAVWVSVTWQRGPCGSRNSGKSVVALPSHPPQIPSPNKTRLNTLEQRQAQVRANSTHLASPWLLSGQPQRIRKLQLTTVHDASVIAEGE